MTPTNPIIEATKAGVSCSKAAAAAPKCDTRLMSAVAKIVNAPSAAYRFRGCEITASRRRQ
jgi:hypothetical protein